jgi:hypothetical protein
VSARLAAIGIAVALAATGPIVVAEPALTAVAADPADVRAAVLVGPSGQVYTPTATGWHRPALGGTAAAILGAARVGTTLYIVTSAAPPFRWTDGAWHAAPIPGVRRGAAVPGSGPAPAVAIGSKIVVATAAGWIDVKGAPAPPTALWAASDRDVWIAARGAIWRRRGSSFARVADGAALTGGDAPWRIEADRARDLATGKTTRAQAGTIVAAAHAGEAIVLLVRGDHGVTVERHGARVEVLAPPTGAWALLWADRAGRIAIAAPTGEVAIYADGAWQARPIDTTAPAPRPGPAAARTVSP